MGQSRAVADVPAEAPWATYGVAITVSGAVTVGLGFVLAGALPVLASVLVGVPSGMAGWLVVRRTLARTVGWPVGMSGAEGADTDPGEPTSAGAPVGVGSEQ